MTTVTLPRGEELPAPKTHEELVILVLDGSGSMSDREAGSGWIKAEAVIHHLIRDEDGLLQRLKTSRNRDGFYLAVVTFDDRVDPALQPRPLSQVVPEDLNIDLLGKHGELTAIGRALEAADRLARDWLAQADPRVPRFVTILVMSDGQETADSDPLGAAQAIQARGQGDDLRPPVVIAAAAYGDDADVAALQAIASQRPDGSTLFKKVDTGQELRDFFMASISSATPGAEL